MEEDTEWGDIEFELHCSTREAGVGYVPYWADPDKASVIESARQARSFVSSEGAVGGSFKHQTEAGSGGGARSPEVG